MTTYPSVTSLDETWFTSLFDYCVGNANLGRHRNVPASQIVGDKMATDLLSYCLDTRSRLDHVPAPPAWENIFVMPQAALFSLAKQSGHEISEGNAMLLPVLAIFRLNSDRSGFEINVAPTKRCRLGSSQSSESDQQKVVSNINLPQRHQSTVKLALL